MKDYCAPRFREEKLAPHWQVDRGAESFSRLIYHLETKSNFKPYFEEAVKNLGLDGNVFGSGLAVADIGAGVCWTSALLARHPKVEIVYGIDASDRRLQHAEHVIRHFGAADKVKIIKGTFLEPNIPDKVDIVVLCGSLHHCYDEFVEPLFSGIRKALKPGGVLLIANEHYVDLSWSVKRVVGYFWHLFDDSRYYSLKTLRSPHPFDGEHWRTRGELEKIFSDNGFNAEFFVHKGDLCKDKPTYYHRIGWRYYNAVLKPKELPERNGN